ncbi:methyltransferase domain-containing protein [Couchioplanes caeruleus]|uniref:class I SAM-dependent methyltransferase n=1 Tax=Couchioplanes caeruleus TaxID=56438 RepID=UPI0020BF4169|nr:class I SAM-dependent methyltransferase [Couchioplanes caeruleus]UQU67994.1 methyltransferase domain-containing protein [Couchioplanes caeruleus]
MSVRRTYDTVARAYDEALRDELALKPLDRALLTAVLESVGEGTVADVGCGPGHVTRFLAERHPDVLGVDLSPAMVTIARRHAPGLPFVAASMLDLPFRPDAFAGAVALYSIIHLGDAGRARAFRELARVIRAGGPLLVAFHVESPEVAAGEVTHLSTWFGAAVDVDVRFLDPEVVSGDLVAAGFRVDATLLREPVPGAEFPSRRAYLVARRSAEA